MPCNKKKGAEDTTCHCAFCNRAVLLWGLGHTRHKSAGKRPFYKIRVEENPPPKKRKSFLKRTPSFDQQKSFPGST